MNVDVIRAWKDDVYRESLTAQQRAQLPGNPAGAIELTEAELAGVDGALTPVLIGLTISLNYLVWVSARGNC
jgi:mersacidin/lichenicidin family type 2 lantibiotic